MMLFRIWLFLAALTFGWAQCHGLDYCQFELEQYCKEINKPFTKKIPFHISENPIAFSADIEIEQKHYYLMKPVVIQQSRIEWTTVDTYIFKYSDDGYVDALGISVMLNKNGKIDSVSANDQFDGEDTWSYKQRSYKDQQNTDVLKELPGEVEKNMAPFVGAKQAEKIGKIVSMHLSAIINSVKPHAAKNTKDK